MQQKTFIFIGRSGCGKGTQAARIMEHLKAEDPTTPIFYMESGDRFRTFLKGNGYTQELSKKIMASGDLQPAFLAVHIWSHLMIEDMSANKHMVIDGTPRIKAEAMILDSAMQFYGRAEPTVVYLNVSREWSKARLAGRGRSDDVVAAEVDKRLGWFDSEVMPAIEYLRESPLYRFIEINGEQTIEEVQQEIMQKVFNS